MRRRSVTPVKFRSPGTARALRVSASGPVPPGIRLAPTLGLRRLRRPKMHGRRLAALCALLVLPAGVWAGDGGMELKHGHHRDPQTTVSCPADVAAALTQLCPCDGFATHGQYVRCVV